MRVAMFAAALTLGVIACSGTTGPQPASVELSLTQVGDHLHLRMTNSGGSPVTIACGSLHVERETPEGWVLSYGQSCIQPGTLPRISVAPGEQRLAEFDPPAPGVTYRGVVTYRTSTSADEDRVFRTAPASW